MQPHTFLHKNHWIKSAMHAVILLLLQSRKFWWYLLLTSSMLFHDVIMTSRHTAASDTQSVWSRLCVPAGQCTSTPRSVRATVELPRQETPNFLAPNLWPPNSPYLSPVDHEIWAVMQHRVYHSVGELKRRLIGLEESIFDEAIDQWRGRHWACVLKEHTERVLKDISCTACELTLLILSISVILFSMTCLTVTSLITKSCQSLPILVHFST